LCQSVIKYLLSFINEYNRLQSFVVDYIADKQMFKNRICKIDFLQKMNNFTGYKYFYG